MEKDREELLEKLILETNHGKYKLVNLIARWAKELKTKEEYKDYTYAEIVDLAIEDVLTGKVSAEEIEKLPPIEKKRKR